jgi:hypothetical protein
VSAESVALIPECTEWDARWLPAYEQRCAAYITDDEPAGGRLLFARAARSGSSARTDLDCVAASSLVRP